MMKKILAFSILFSAFLFNLVYALDAELGNQKDARVFSLKICKNGAKSTKMGKYEFCKCLPGTFGDDCGIVPDCIDEVLNCTEKSDSVCGYNVQFEEAECICNNSSLSYDKNTETCRSTCNETKPCKNGGTCTAAGNYEFCKCISGTNGDSCEYVTSCVEESLLCNDKSGAICGFNVLDERPECLCYNGLKYDQNIELCRETCNEEKLCENGGTCKVTGHYSFCECIPGTSGHKCNDVSNCINGNVTCKDVSGAVCGFNVEDERAECLCQSGLKYDIASQTCRETCNEKKLCENGGTCKVIGHYSFCECIPGTSGPTCNDVSNCTNGSVTCNNKSGAVCGFNVDDERAECLCQSGLKYDIANQICKETCNEMNLCKNGGTCKVIGHYSFCECIPETTGHLCSDVSNCINENVICNNKSGAVCGFNVEDQRAECLCQSELKYDIASETCRETCNEEKLCENGGTCKVIGHYSFCECIPGTSGHTCSDVSNCTNRGLTCKDGSGAVCGFNVDDERAECLCQSGMKYDIATGTCRETCSDLFPCTNGGVCKRVGNYDFCDCISGTYGDFCIHVTSCVEESMLCNDESGAKCGFNVLEERPECLCYNGLKYDTNLEKCRETCETQDHDCQNGAACTSIGHYNFCECLNGTYGDYCENVTDCNRNYMACKEDSGATCGYNPSLKVAECLCENGLKYDRNTETCREICISDKDCQNGAPCKNTDNYNFCNCLYGTDGHRCEKVFDCDINYVTCNEDSGATCGYNPNLEIAECLCKRDLKYDRKTETCRETCGEHNFDCENEAACITIGYHNFCDCLNGTYGHYCENVTDCDRNYVTCKKDSGSTCGYNPSLKVAECLCENGLKYDRNTETCRETCDPAFDTCANGAPCINILGYDFCMCHPRTSGNKCEYISDCENKVLECNITSGLICGFNETAREAECLCKDDTLIYDRDSEMCLSYTSSTDVYISSTYHTVSTFSTVLTTDVGRTRPQFTTTNVPYINKCNSSLAVCPKLSTLCVPKGNDYYCKCKIGFRLRTGTVKEFNKMPCIRKTCDCGINSYNCQWSVQGRKICSCFHGYSQIRGVCTDCNCGMNSLACVFDDKGRKLCGCKTGYFQRNETCSEMCTNDKDCQNGGICNFESNGYFCKCKPQFKGDRCEINEEYDHLRNTCSAIGAIYQYIESFRKGICVCPPNRYFNDKSNICEDTYESDSSLFIVLCITSGFLLVSTIILVIVFKAFRSS